MGGHPGPARLGGLPRAGAVIFATGGMDSLPSVLPTALRELIRYVRPPWLRRWARDGYAWLQPRLSPVARPALPPHLSAEYLEQTRGAIDFNRPGIPIVASLPSVHVAPTYGKAHHGRRGPRPRSRSGRTNTMFPWWTSKPLWPNML